MGYTHYFNHKKSIEPNAWKKITVSFTSVINTLPQGTESAGAYYANSPIKVQFEDNDPRPAQIDDSVIRFNGEEELGHETFYLPRYLTVDDSPVLFCKTARKPYDHAVCAALILLHHFAPGCNEISSDGEPTNWMPALTHVREVLNNPDIKLPPGVGDEALIVAPEAFQSTNEWFFA